MGRVKQSVTVPGMTQVEALDTIRAAEHKVYITVEDCARASGLSAVTIREQAREDAKNGTNELGYTAIIAKSRVAIDRLSFLEFIDKGRCQRDSIRQHQR